VGRVDAKTHRGEGRLEVRHVHFERWAAAGSAPPAGRGPRLETDEILAGLADALVSLGRFVCAERIVLRRVTPGRLRAPLARVLRSASST
jgi:uncharacterized protein YcaQ